MKFVVQHHTNGRDHFDLMIEYGESLLTWQVSALNLKLLLDGNRVEVKRIHEHRREFLSYEGLISGNRGSVKIFDSGECKSVLFDKDIIELKMRGSIFKGIIRVQKLENDIFLVEYLIDDVQ